MFRVNHNGTEDWTDAAKHDERTGAAVFDTIEDARAFGVQIATEAIEWQVNECGMDLDQARYMLSDNRDGVPVQIITPSGRVVETIDPSNLGGESDEDRERDEDELLALREKHGCDAVVSVGLYKIGVRVSHDKDGGAFLELLGLDCNLEGEMPGIYYPAPIGA